MTVRPITEMQKKALLDTLFIRIKKKIISIGKQKTVLIRELKTRSDQVRIRKIHDELLK